jgi:hypothetical protein
MESNKRKSFGGSIRDKLKLKKSQNKSKVDTSQKSVGNVSALTGNSNDTAKSLPTNPPTLPKKEKVEKPELPKLPKLPLPSFVPLIPIKVPEPPKSKKFKT